MNAAVCPICHEVLDPHRYRLAAYDQTTWKSPMVCYPAPCWDNREQLRAPGVQVVGKPDPQQPMMVQFVA